MPYPSGNPGQLINADLQLRKAREPASFDMSQKLVMVTDTLGRPDCGQLGEHERMQRYDPRHTVFGAVTREQPLSSDEIDFVDRNVGNLPFTAGRQDHQ